MAQSDQRDKKIVNDSEKHYDSSNVLMDSQNSSLSRKTKKAVKRENGARKVKLGFLSKARGRTKVDKRKNVMSIDIPGGKSLKQRTDDEKENGVKGDATPIRLQGSKEQPRSETTRSKSNRAESVEIGKGPTQTQKNSNSPKVEKGPKQKQRNANSAEIERGPEQKQSKAKSTKIDIGTEQKQRKANSTKVEKGSKQKQRKASSAEIEKGPRQKQRREETESRASSENFLKSLENHSVLSKSLPIQLFIESIRLQNAYHTPHVPTILKIMDGLGIILRERGYYVLSLECLKEQTAVVMDNMRKKRTKDGKEAYNIMLASIMARAGNVHRQNGKIGPALKCFTKARKVLVQKICLPDDERRVAMLTRIISRLEHSTTAIVEPKKILLSEAPSATYESLVTTI